MGVFDKGHASNHLEDEQTLSQLSQILLKAGNRITSSFMSSNVPVSDGKYIMFFYDGVKVMFMVILNNDKVYAKLVDDIQEYVFTDTIFDLTTGTVVNTEDIEERYANQKQRH